MRVRMTTGTRATLSSLGPWGFPACPCILHGVLSILDAKHTHRWTWTETSCLVFSFTDISDFVERHQQTGQVFFLILSLPVGS